MQSLTGPLRCADCDDNHDFSSAASLLSHFAQHIIIAEATTAVEASSNPASPRRNKSDDILQHILQRTAKRSTPKKKVRPSGSELPMLLPINPSHDVCKINKHLESFHQKKAEPNANEDHASNIMDCKDRQDTLLNQSSNCSSTSSTSSTTSSINGHLLTSNILNGASVNLAKFDMQQRLENCVLNLVSKRHVKRPAESVVPDLPQLIPTKKIFSENTENWDGGGAEEINPVTLCTVTIDDGENSPDSDEFKFEMSKKNSSRKQLVPKKISRPENEIIHELSSKLPENTTLTTVDCSSPEREKSISKKKYPCHICSKVFGWSTDLKRHILIHTGERPFKCKLCPSSFTRNFLLQKHESKVHYRNNGKSIVNGQLEAIALKLHSTEQRDSYLSLLPNLDIPFEISSKQLDDATEMSEEDGEIEGDDRSSADENDNHNQKLTKVSIEMQEPCHIKQPWHPSNLAQEALQ